MTRTVAVAAPLTEEPATNASVVFAPAARAIVPAAAALLLAKGASVSPGGKVSHALINKAVQAAEVMVKSAGKFMAHLVAVASRQVERHPILFAPGSRLRVASFRGALIPVSRFLQVCPKAGATLETAREQEHAIAISDFRSAPEKLDRFERVRLDPGAIDIKHSEISQRRIISELRGAFIKAGRFLGVLLDAPPTIVTSAEQIHRPFVA